MGQRERCKKKTLRDFLNDIYCEKSGLSWCCRCYFQSREVDNRIWQLTRLKIIVNLFFSLLERKKALNEDANRLLDLRRLLANRAMRRNAAARECFLEAGLAEHVAAFDFNSKVLFIVVFAKKPRFKISKNLDLRKTNRTLKSRFELVKFVLCFFKLLFQVFVFFAHFFKLLNAQPSRFLSQVFHRRFAIRNLRR